MIKNLVCLEHEIAGKKFCFIADLNSTTGPVKEALCHFLMVVGQIEDQAKADAERIKAEQEAHQQVTEVKVEEPNQGES